MTHHRLKRLSVTLLFAISSCLVLTPALCPAAVKEVTLFPASAKVEASVRIRPQATDTNKHKITLLLPSQADPESLNVSLPPSGGAKIDDIQIKSVARVDETRIAGLRSRLTKAQNEKNELLARINALNAQLQFWQAQIKAKTKTIAEADQLAAAIGKNTRRMHYEKNTVEEESRKTEKLIKELEALLDEATGQGEKVYEALVSLTGSVRPDAEISYSYILRGCGWQPVYRLEALPSSGSVIFSWDAQVWQSAGEDWQNIRLNLATLQPVRTIAPGDLPAWLIRPKSPVLYRSTRASKPAPASLSASQEDAATADSAPRESIHTTYRTWSAGTITLPAGQKQRLKIKDDAWHAVFLFLARPSLSPQVFVQAKFKLAEPVEIPPGEATFLIDGAVIGKRNFTLAGTEADIYFGISPLVTVKQMTLTDKTGASDIFRQKQTRSWTWRMEAINAGSAPVRLRIEEPVPQAGDERIKLKFRHNPEPAQNDTSMFVWTMDLPGLHTEIIETGIELEAPADMPLDFGWRWPERLH
ncbi:MAG: mucoidy inhibitor MuiA family protein [Smithella sp.]|jgi:uncharacterized protein (TIGR02231 family)|nr:mucoidy inhibitor MuiA family protein [Smithella sp.]